jgi:predicted nucleic acid-binding protein
MTTVFIDTDIILDFLADRKPFTEEAAFLFTLIDQKKIKGCISSLCFSNLYFILRKVGIHAKVIKTLLELAELVEILKVDEITIKSALSSGFKDFEDAIQYYAAMESGKVDVLITRNVKDYKSASIPVMSPDSFLKTINLK